MIISYLLIINHTINTITNKHAIPTTVFNALRATQMAPITIKIAKPKVTNIFMKPGKLMNGFNIISAIFSLFKMIASRIKRSF